MIDWGPLGTAKGIAQRMTEVEAGDIILMHDGLRQHNRPQIIAQLLPQLLEQLAQRSIIAVALDDLV